MQDIEMSDQSFAKIWMESDQGALVQVFEVSFDCDIRNSADVAQFVLPSQAAKNQHDSTN
jgi:hypothetical protein